MLFYSLTNLTNNNIDSIPCNLLEVDPFEELSKDFRYFWTVNVKVCNIIRHDVKKNEKKIEIVERVINLSNPIKNTKFYNSTNTSLEIESCLAEVNIFCHNHRGPYHWKVYSAGKKVHQRHFWANDVEFVRQQSSQRNLHRNHSNDHIILKILTLKESLLHQFICYKLTSA